MLTRCIGGFVQALVPTIFTHEWWNFFWMDDLHHCLQAVNNRPTRINLHEQHTHSAWKSHTREHPSPPQKKKPLIHTQTRGSSKGNSAHHAITYSKYTKASKYLYVDHKNFCSVGDTHFSYEWDTQFLREGKFQVILERFLFEYPNKKQLVSSARPISECQLTMASYE